MNAKEEEDEKKKEFLFCCCSLYVRMCIDTNTGYGCELNTCFILIYFFFYIKHSYTRVINLLCICLLLIHVSVCMNLCLLYCSVCDQNMLRDGTSRSFFVLLHVCIHIHTRIILAFGLALHGKK